MTFFDPEAASNMVFGDSADDGPIGRVRRVQASRATDPAIAAAGQGGGTVTALMIAALEAGLVDSAVLTTVPAGELYSRGVVCTSIEEIVSCSGSRYVGSHSLSAVKQALDNGFQRVGVVALPCQVRSLRKMALYDLKNENLRERIALVVGLFCNWAFASRDFTHFLANRSDLGRVKRLHIPPPPANTLEVESDRGKYDIPLDDLRFMIQDACRLCPDMTSEFADASVGMYEGREGWNTLITRTSLGEKLVNGAVSTGSLETAVFPEPNLEHLKSASTNKRVRYSTARGSESE